MRSGASPGSPDQPRARVGGPPWPTSSTAASSTCALIRPESGARDAATAATAAALRFPHLRRVRRCVGHLPRSGESLSLRAAPRQPAWRPHRLRLGCVTKAAILSAPLAQPPRHPCPLAVGQRVAAMAPCRRPWPRGRNLRECDRPARVLVRPTAATARSGSVGRRLCFRSRRGCNPADPSSFATAAGCGPIANLEAPLSRFLV